VALARRNDAGAEIDLDDADQDGREGHALPRPGENQGRLNSAAGRDLRWAQSCISCQNSLSGPRRACTIFVFAPWLERRHGTYCRSKSNGASRSASAARKSRSIADWWSKCGYRVWDGCWRSFAGWSVRRCRSMANRAAAPWSQSAKTAAAEDKTGPAFMRVPAASRRSFTAPSAFAVRLVWRNISAAGLAW